MLLAALYNDYADEDIPDVDQDISDVDPSEVCMEEQPADEPAVEPSVSPSTRGLTKVGGSLPRAGSGRLDVGEAAVRPFDSITGQGAGRIWYAYDTG